MSPPIFKTILFRLRTLRTSIFLVLGILVIFFISAQVFPEHLLTKSAIARSTSTQESVVINSSTEQRELSPSSYTFSDNLLRLGDRTPAVATLQNDLKSLGYEAVGETVGLFDSATERAVRRFQRTEKLSVDGIAGPITLAQIAAVNAGDPETISSHTRALLPADIQRILDRGKLIVSLLERDNPPFFMVGKDNQLEGFDVTMAKAIATALDVDVEFRRTATTFDEVVDDVYTHQADLAISKISRTLKRARRTRFSEPYLNLRQGLLVNRLELAQNSQENNMTEMIRNLNGKIAVIEGSSYAGFAKQKFPQATVVSYPNWSDVVEAVTSGTVLAAYRDELEVKKIVLSRPDAALQFQTIALTDTQDPLSVVLPWDSEHLLAFVNQYLESSGLSYTTDSLLEEYADYFQS